MAKNKPKAERRGPYLAAAVFCDNVLLEQNGTVSAIRIIDQARIVIPASAPANVPSKEHRVPVVTNGLLSFRTGKGRGGQHKVRIVMESPAGKVAKQERPLDFTEDENGGGNLIFPTTIMVYESGIFYFDVYLDDKLMTRMPLKIIVEREQVPAPQAGTDPSPAADSSPARKNGERRRKKP